MPEGEKKELTEDEKEARQKMFDAALADAIAISHRFSPEPVFGPTGKGYMKSEGVEELKKIKKSCENL